MPTVWGTDSGCGGGGMIVLLIFGVIVGIIVLYAVVMKIAAIAIIADERLDSDFGYYGRFSRLDSWL